MMNSGKYHPVKAARLVAAVIAAGCMALAGPGCVRKPAESPAMPPPNIAVATAVSHDVPLNLNADGVTTARESVSIVAQVEGQIVAMPFQQGAMVKKGDQLAVIFQPPFIAAVEKARGQVASDQANLDLAKLQVERSRQLLADKYVSQQQFDSYVAQVKAYEGQLQVDQAQLLTEEINLNYTNITAPVDGMIGTYMINVGNVVKVNDQVITTIQSLDPIYADFVVSEADFPKVKAALQKSNGKLPVILSGMAKDAEERTGELAILGNAVSSTTGTVSLRATVANSDRLFWPNQPIRARIQLEILKNAVLIPEEAVMLSQQGQYTFVIVAPKTSQDPATVDMRMVQTGPTESTGLTVITSGVNTGEQVVVGAFRMLLQAGTPVNIVEVDGKQLAPPPGAPGDRAGGPLGAERGRRGGTAPGQ